MILYNNLCIVSPKKQISHSCTKYHTTLVVFFSVVKNSNNEVYDIIKSRALNYQRRNTTIFLNEALDLGVHQKTIL